MDLARRHTRWILAAVAIRMLAAAGGAVVPGGESVRASELREPVHPRRNVEAFDPVEARWVRFTVHRTNRSEPGVDEFEVYGPDDPGENLALAAHGARVTASGSIEGYRIHEVNGINDGIYGNGHCWIADRIEGAWVTVELAEPRRIDRIVWGRDREGRFVDRLATDYVIEVADDLAGEGGWRTVASSADRRPLDLGRELSPGNPWFEQVRMRFSSVPGVEAGEAQPPSGYVVDVWQSEHGLPGNVITALLQSNEGYLWIGTPSGLARFDGSRFVTFGEQEGLPDPRVRCLGADRSGALWIGTEGGLVRMKDGGFVAYSVDDGLPSPSIDAVLEDGEGNLRISAGGSVVRWRDGAALGPPIRIQSPPLRMVAAGDDEFLLLGESLLRWGEGVPVAVEQADEPSNFSSLGALHVGPSGRMWYGGANGYLGALHDGDLAIYSSADGLPSAPIWEVLETRGGEVWVGTAGSGLIRMRNGVFTAITTLEGLASNSVRCLLEDREGNVWVGTNGGGLHRLKQSRILTFTPINGLTHEVVTSLAEGDNGAVFVGTNGGGLSVLEADICRPLHLSYLLDNAAVRSLLVARAGGLWIGTLGNGLFRWSDGRLTSVGESEGRWSDISALAEDAEGGLWVGSLSGGLGRVSAGARAESGDGEGFKILDHPGLDVLPPGDPSSGGEAGPDFKPVADEATLGGAVSALAFTPDGVLWVGTSGGGLWRWSDDGGARRRFAGADGLPSSFIRALVVGSDGTLWVGTLAGICRFDGNRFVPFPARDDRREDVASQIVEASDGALWVGTNRGLLRLETDSDHGDAGEARVIEFGKADGLATLEFTGGYAPAGLRTRDGRLLFGSMRGLVVIDDGGEWKTAAQASVLIEEVHADGAIVGDGELPRGAKRIEFIFTAPVLSAPERVRFRYRLAGLEDEWSPAGSDRIASYAGLPPGRYAFEVEATDSLGRWTGQIARMTVRLRPEWWETDWFRGALLALFLALVGVAVRLAAARRYRRRLAALEQEHALTKERARIARDIHDDLGAHLTEISLLSERGRRQPTEAGPFLERIAQTSRDLVRDVDAIVWAVNPRHDSIDSLAAYLGHSASEYLASAGIRCRLNIPTELPELRLTSEVRHQVLLAVKEAIHNAVRHSGAETVWLTLGFDDGVLRIEVRDNGAGFNPDAAVAAGEDGLSNMRERIALAGGRCEIASAPGSGTRVVFTLRPDALRSALNPSVGMRAGRARE